MVAEFCSSFPSPNAAAADPGSTIDVLFFLAKLGVDCEDAVGILALMGDRSSAAGDEASVCGDSNDVSVVSCVPGVVVTDSLIWLILRSPPCSREIFLECGVEYIGWVYVALRGSLSPGTDRAGEAFSTDAGRGGRGLVSVEELSSRVRVCVWGEAGSGSAYLDANMIVVSTSVIRLLLPRTPWKFPSSDVR